MKVTNRFLYIFFSKIKDKKFLFNCYHQTDISRIIIDNSKLEELLNDFQREEESEVNEPEEKSQEDPQL